MSNYTQSELKSMTRVELRRAAIKVLNIDNKEASNTKTDNLIAQIVEKQDGGGAEEKPAAKTSSRSTKSRASKATTSKATSRKNGSNGKTAAPASDEVSTLVHAVGKAVDDSKDELITKFEDVLDNQDHVNKQMFILLGLVTDIYKAVDEPDVLEERIQELNEEWDSQGNE